MFLRLLLLLVVTMLVVRWVQSGLRALLDPESAPREPKVVPKAKKERLVGCSVCGVHVVESRALIEEAPGARVVCSEACRQRARAAS